MREKMRKKNESRMNKERKNVARFISGYTAAAYETQFIQTVHVTRVNKKESYLDIDDHRDCFHEKNRYRFPKCSPNTSRFIYKDAN